MFHPLGARLSLNYHLLISSLLFPQCFWNLHSKRKNRMQYFNWNDKCWNTRKERKWLLREKKIASRIELNVTANTWSQWLPLCPLWHRCAHVPGSLSCSIKANRVGGSRVLAVVLCCSWQSLTTVVSKCRGTLTMFPWLMVKFEIKEGKQHCDVFLLFLY